MLWLDPPHLNKFDNWSHFGNRLV